MATIQVQRIDASNKLLPRCTTSRLLAELVGHRYLTDLQLRTIEKAGFTVIELENVGTPSVARVLVSKLGRTQ